MKLRITKEENPHDHYHKVKYKAYVKHWWQSKWKFLCWEPSLKELRKSIDHYLALEEVIIETAINDYISNRHREHYLEQGEPV